MWKLPVFWCFHGDGDLTYEISFEVLLGGKSLGTNWISKYENSYTSYTFSTTFGVWYLVVIGSASSPINISGPEPYLTLVFSANSNHLVILELNGAGFSKLHQLLLKLYKQVIKFLGYVRQYCPFSSWSHFIIRIRALRSTSYDITFTIIHKHQLTYSSNKIYVIFRSASFDVEIYTI